MRLAREIVPSFMEMLEAGRAEEAFVHLIPKEGCA